MKKNLVILLFVIYSCKLFAWRIVSVEANGQHLTAFIPENLEEQYVADQTAINVYTFEEFLEIVTAYQFSEISNENLRCSENYHHQTYEPFPLVQSALNINAMPFIPKENRLLDLYPLGQVKKYCHNFAFKGQCFRRNCKYDHISKKDMKNKVACFKHMMGNCESEDCIHYHVSGSQSYQAAEAKKEGINIPVIFCDKQHKTDIEKRFCPYLHTK
jgi:hypothetical protein